MKRVITVLLIVLFVISGCDFGRKADRQTQDAMPPDVQTPTVETPAVKTPDAKALGLKDPGVKAPGFTLPSLYTGEMISLADLRGHPVLLMFFSPG